MVRYIVRELGFAPVPLDGVLPEGVLAAKERLEEKMRVAGREACPGLTEEESRACIRGIWSRTDFLLPDSGVWSDCGRRRCFAAGARKR